MAALLGRLADLGYGVAYRVLDARHFGVPQRRRRVFILGLRSDPDDPDGRVAAERAAQVLSVGARCRRHPPTGVEAGPEPAAGAGVGVAHALTRTMHKRHDEDTDTLVCPSPDPDGVRTPDGLAGRLDGGTGVAAFVKSHNVSDTDGERWTDADRESRSMNGFDGDYTSLVAGSNVSDDPLLPLGLDSHRYRCCGNGVVAPVAEWLGARLAALFSPDDAAFTAVPSGESEPIHAQDEPLRASGRRFHGAPNRPPVQGSKGHFTRETRPSKASEEVSTR